MEKPFLSPNETAELFGCHRTSIYRLMRTGRLPAHKLGGKTLLNRAEVLALVKATSVYPAVKRAA